MALKLNGVDVTVYKLNGSDVEKETLNGVIVYQNKASAWVLNSGSTAYQLTHDMGQVTLCPQEAAALTALNGAYPASNYSVGHTARVISRSRFGDCGTYYFITQ